jgi:hypothetical protein
MQPMYYIGLDVHKRKISCCVKDGSGRIHAEGSISATRLELDHWMRSLPQPWSVAMEATMFTDWIYDHLKPHAAETICRSGFPSTDAFLNDLPRLFRGSIYAWFSAHTASCWRP